MIKLFCVKENGLYILNLLLGFFLGFVSWNFGKNCEMDRGNVVG